MATVVTIQAEGRPVNVVVVEKTGNTTTKELAPGQRWHHALLVDQELRVVHPVQDV